MFKKSITTIAALKQYVVKMKQTNKSCGRKCSIYILTLDLFLIEVPGVKK